VSAISERDGGGGKKLSYVEGWWAIAKMNEIFPGGWSYDASETREIYREKEEKNGKVYWLCAYSAKCRVDVAGVRVADVGHGTAKDQDLGKAVEKAEKEAATDSLKRCLKSLGNVLGLALYDKDKERANVVDDTQVHEPVRKPIEEADAVLRRWPSMSEEERKSTWAALTNEVKTLVKNAREQQAMKGRAA
jgi:DNA recombination protein Rad52